MGDAYMFKRDEVTDMEEVEKSRSEYRKQNVDTTSNIHDDETPYKQIFDPNVRYEPNRQLNQSVIVKAQELKDLYKWGRRIGNIQYRDGV